MSTILHRRNCHVAISALDAGLEFVLASHDAQAEFLRGMALAIEDEGGLAQWKLACRLISEDMPRDKAVNVAVAMETLAYEIRNRNDGFIDEQSP